MSHIMLKILYSPYMLTWNNPVDSYFSFHLSAHRNSEDAICSPSRSCSDEGLKCTEGVKQRKMNIKKQMGILTLALRIDNPSNGFEITFLENYDPPIQFHRQFCELAHSTMVLLCFLCIQKYSKTIVLCASSQNYL